MPFNPDAAPHANAAALIAEHGDGDIDAIWRIGRELMHTGRGADIPRLAEAMKIVLALRRAGREGVRH